jgi:hypothetical protein
MSNAAIVADTLSAWREAERLLEAFPPNSTDHETARLLIGELRELYGELTMTKDDTDGRLLASRGTIARARSVLAALETRHNGNGPDGA